jgi:hypothetical protein
MLTIRNRVRLAASIVVAIVMLGLAIPRAMAHCDTMDGPVVAAAKKALESKDVTPVLRWVKADDEKVVREVFQKTLAVRAKGDDARQLADMYFFETLVRIHRASEGEPYTGLKPTGTEIEPPVRAADKALESGSAEEVTKLITDTVGKGIQERFAHAKETRAHADESVETGRKAVAAYVEFVHYVDQLHADASSSAHAAHAGHGEAAAIPGGFRMGLTALGAVLVLALGGGLMLVARRGS